MKGAFLFAQDGVLFALAGQLVAEALLPGWRATPGPSLVRDRTGAVRGQLLAVPWESLSRWTADQAGLPTRRHVRTLDGRRLRAWVSVGHGVAPGTSKPGGL